MEPLDSLSEWVTEPLRHESGEYRDDGYQWRQFACLLGVLAAAGVGGFVVYHVVRMLSG